MDAAEAAQLDVDEDDAALANEIRASIAEDDPRAIGLLGQLADSLLLQERGLEALSMRERALVLMKDHYGLDSDVFAQESERLALLCNTLAMEHLREQSAQVASKLLRKADALTDPNGVMRGNPRRVSVRAVTLNNLGCYYKEQKKYHTALSYLQRALKLEAGAGLRDNPAGTHLNMCAILSHMHKHREALQHARLALDMVLLDEEARGEEKASEEQQRAASRLTDVLREHASTAEAGVAGPRDGDGGGGARGGADPAAADAPEGGEQTSLLAIAYFNLAVQHEHLHQYESALGAYDGAVSAAERDLGPEHPMTEGMRRTMRAVETTARKAMAKNAGRRLSPREPPNASVFDRLSARYNPPREKDVLGSPRLSPRASPRASATAWGTAATQRKPAVPAGTQRVAGSTTRVKGSAVR